LGNRALRFLLYSFIALTAFGVGVWMNRTHNTEAPAAADVILGITLPDLQNKMQALNQWRGKVLVVNFWATWCAPCREEIPIFVKMQDKYRDKGLQFVGISIDQADKTAAFSSNFKINYPILIGTFDTMEISTQAGNTKRVLPYTVILDHRGQIAATELGGLTEEKLEFIVKSLL